MLATIRLMSRAQFAPTEDKDEWSRAQFAPTEDKDEWSRAQLAPTEDSETRRTK